VQLRRQQSLDSDHALTQNDSEVAGPVIRINDHYHLHVYTTQCYHSMGIAILPPQHVSLSILFATWISIAVG